MSQGKTLLGRYMAIIHIPLALHQQHKLISMLAQLAKVKGSQFPQFQTSGRTQKRFHGDLGGAIFIHRCHSGRDLVQVKVSNVMEKGREARLPTQALLGRVQIVAQDHGNVIGVIRNPGSHDKKNSACPECMSCSKLVSYSEGASTSTS